MKICVFSDVHGNLEQFQKLCSTEDFLEADVRVCLGDMVGLGPYPKECMDLLFQFPHKMLLGNHEARMIGLLNDMKNHDDRELARQYMLFEEQLVDYKEYFRSLDRQFSMTIAGKKFLFTHYGWSGNDMAMKDVVLKYAPMTKQFGIKDGEYDYVIYGHMHCPDEQVENGTTFFDVGSLGLKSPSNYLVITAEDGNLVLERKHLPMDREKFLKDCEKIGYPRWEILNHFSFRNDSEFNANVLVTGGAGYIGSNIVAKLCKDGYNCIIVDNFSNSYEKTTEKLRNRYKNLTKIYNVDILDTKKLEEIISKEKIDIVVHMAGKKYVKESFEKENEYFEQNVLATKSLLQAMQNTGVKKIVFSSSITVYGNCGKECVDENIPLNPLSPYARQKVECENIIKDWQKSTANGAVILRLSNPAGANTTFMLGDNPKIEEYIGVVPYMINKALNDEEIFINGDNHPTKDGTTVRDYVHVEDVANAFVLAVKYLMDREQICETFNVGSGKVGYSVKDIILTVGSVLDKNLTYHSGPKRDGDTSIFLSDITKAQTTLLFNPTFNLKDMIDSQYQFIQNVENN